MRYVKRYQDRDGAARLYFRKADHPKNGEALTSPWPEVEAGSALEAEVAAILATGSVVKARATNLAGAMRAYELSADFKSRAEETRQDYSYKMAEFERDYGALPITSFSPSAIQELREEWALRGYRAANIRLQLLKNILRPQMVALNRPDPFAQIKGVSRPRSAKEAHVVWSDDAVETVIREAITLGKFGLARAVAIGRYAGARRGDIVKMLRTARTVAYPSNQPRIAWLSSKRSIPVNMREDPRLTRWLGATPEQQPLSRWQAYAQGKAGVLRLPPATLVYNISNERYTEDGIGQELAKLVKALHAAGRLDGDQYNLHGLRHTFGVELTLASCTDAQGAAMMGHAGASTFQIYRRQAGRVTMSDAAADRLDALREAAVRTGPEREVSNNCLKVSNWA